MNKKISVLLALCLLLMLVGTACGGNDAGDASSLAASESPTASAAQGSAAPEQTPAPSQSAGPIGSTVSFDDATVRIGGAEWITEDGEEYLCIYLDVTNDSEGIMAPSDISFGVLQNGEELRDMDGYIHTYSIHAHNRARYMYPGITLRAAYFVQPQDKESELTITLSSDDDEQQITMDPANLPTVIPEPSIGEAHNLDFTSLSGYEGTSATLENTVFPGGKLEIVGHDFVEQSGETFVRVYFNLEFTHNIDKGETETPYMQTTITCYQDGVQLGDYTNMDDRILLQGDAAIPELSAQSQAVGLNEPVTFAVAYKLRSDSEITMTATFFGLVIEWGESFVGDTFPVE